MLERPEIIEDQIDVDKASLEELKKHCDELSRYTRELETRERYLTIKRGDDKIVFSTPEAEELDEQILFCQKERMVAEKGYRKAHECWSDKFAALFPDDEHARRWIELKRKKSF